VKRLAESSMGFDRSRDLDLFVKVLRRVVGTEISTVAPERSVFHQAVLQEDALSGLDVVAGPENLARRRYHPRGNGRGVGVGEGGDDRQDRKSKDHHQDRAVAPPRGQPGTCGAHRLPPLQREPTSPRDAGAFFNSFRGRIARQTFAAWFSSGETVLARDLFRAL